jgi:hypothetical protein
MVSRNTRLLTRTRNVVREVYYSNSDKPERSLICVSAANRRIWMPRACPVEPHVRRYKKQLVQKSGRSRQGKVRLRISLPSSFSSSEREAPRGKPVASGFGTSRFFVAVNVSLHGASPWHPDSSRVLCSSEREPPRGKPVASRFFTSSL